LIDAYLDDLLEETERAAFERGLESDARLRAEVEGQRRIDGALGRLFAPPVGNALASRITTLVRESILAPNRRPVVRMPARVSRWRRLAIAAALTMGVVGLYRLWDFVQPSRPRDIYAPQAWRSFEKVYRDTVAGGFKPGWVCKNDREFATAFRRRLGQALLLLPPPPGVAWAGLDYCNSITPRTMFLLAWVQGEKVLVLVDQAGSDRGQALPPESRLHLFRRQVGNLVLYECTPLDQPYVLDNFYIPDLSGP
jgi:hypothetical protein